MVKERIEELQKNICENEAVIITSSCNRLYFTAFNSSAGTVVITEKTAYLLIDFRYFEKASKTVVGCEVVLCKSYFKQLAEILSQNEIKTLYFETDSISLEDFKRFKKEFSDFEVSDSRKIQDKITELRSIKSAEELNLIKQAQALTDQTFSYIIERIKPGISEIDLMLDMEFFMRKSGSEGVSFDFIVVSGKNSSLPHGVPTNKQIEVGDFVTMDFGAVVGGYRSDMTRTVAVGNVSEKQRIVYNTVLEAQKMALDFIKPGVCCLDVDKVARDFIAKSGYGNCFGHGLGHSVGIDIHESPACNTSCRTIMKPGMVMTIEPGIYIENEFGVRIEDMVFLTENATINLTNSSKDLIIL